MPTWSGILHELQESQKGNRPPQFDLVRQKYIGALHEATGRDVILYASKFTQSGGSAPPNTISIGPEDLQGIMEVVHGLKGPNLDLIIHSPGGSLEAAEALVTYLRSKFAHIRVAVPQMAMSAATMIACAADIVLMGKHSFLGPIDPQIIINTPLGPRMVPAQAILEQFKMARNECRDPRTMGAWLPMLAQYGPDLLVQCKHATDLAEELVRKWLDLYMFKGVDGGAAKAQVISSWLASHTEFKSHGRFICRTQLEEKGLVIEHLESSQDLQDQVLSVFHATTHTFDGTNAVKIIQNHLGKAFIKQSQTLMVPIQMPAAPSPAPRPS